MRLENYILADDGRTPIVEGDLHKWAQWYEEAERHVANDDLNGVRISTVFLGIDHSFNEGVPILWETMIFGGEHDGYQERYATYEEALAGHAEALKLANSKHEISGQSDPEAPISGDAT